VRVAAAAVAAAVLAIAVFALVWFQPQKLLVDERVDEALPAAPLPPTETAEAEAPRPGLETLSLQRFRSHEHATEGRARVLRLPDGRRYVRFERFRTSNGPVLRVYLSAAAAHGRDGAFDERFADLGRLKGNVGDQNYAIPPGTDLRAFRSVVVWCKRFAVPFAAAPLTTGAQSA
jgi:electron transfer DM13